MDDPEIYAAIFGFSLSLIKAGMAIGDIIRRVLDRFITATVSLINSAVAAASKSYSSGQILLGSDEPQPLTDDDIPAVPHVDSGVYRYEVVVETPEDIFGLKQYRTIRVLSSVLLAIEDLQKQVIDDISDYWLQIAVGGKLDSIAISSISITRGI